MRHFFCNVMLFYWFWEESRGLFFLRFGGQSGSNRDYFGTLLQLYYTKVGKLKTSVSLLPNTTFSSFEGLGRNILGNFSQYFFWYGFWVMILRFFSEIGGPAGAPKTTCLWILIFMVLFYVDFYEFQGVPRIPHASKVGGDLHGPGAPNYQFIDIWKQTVKQQLYGRWIPINKRQPKPLTDTWKHD